MVNEPRDSSQSLTVASLRTDCEDDDRDQGRDEDDVVREHDGNFGNHTADAVDGGQNPTEVRKGRRQLERHDPCPEEARRTAARRGLPLEVDPQTRAHAPEHRGEADERAADDQLHEMPGVRGRMCKPREQRASDREKEHNASERRHEKDTGREGKQAAWRARSEGKDDGRNDGGWIQRIQRCNRDDEDNDSGHAASFSHVTRVLILSASVGEGHDRPAQTLAAQLRDENRADVEIVIEDCLAAMGRSVRAVSEDAARLVFYRFQWVWDVGFWVFAVNPLTRELSQRLITRAGRRGLLGLIDRVAPDVIVSVYPNVTEVLGRLKRKGRIDLPVVAAITDLAAMHYWASRGVDVHLVTHPESVAEVRSIVGQSAVVECVHGFTLPQFRLQREQDDARRLLELPLKGKIVLVSGGGWGVGDVKGAVQQALTLDDVSQVVCLCGRNETLRKTLVHDFTDELRVRVEGFTEHMPEWLAAADALVHSTGGLTVLEALMRGCPAISYGWGRGHVRVNNRAFVEHGLADVVADRAALPAALERAFARERTSLGVFDDLPSAASLVLAAVNAR